jgi:hypothetical protein
MGILMPGTSDPAAFRLNLEQQRKRAEGFAPRGAGDAVGGPD